jgi:hypothetical protein
MAACCGSRPVRTSRRATRVGGDGAVAGAGPGGFEVVDADRTGTGFRPVAN